MRRKRKQDEFSKLPWIRPATSDECALLAIAFNSDYGDMSFEDWKLFRDICSDRKCVEAAVEIMKNACSFISTYSEYIRISCPVDMPRKG
jgi:hypothetical protein